MNDITELVKKAANGDRAAFDRLYERTKKGVWFTCISLLKNEENAKDIMQDTYLAAFEKLNTLENQTAVQAWLNRIAANKCKNFLSAVSNSTLTDNVEDDILENIPDDALIPEDHVIDAEKRGIIMNIIENSLSAEQYTTIILYYFDDMTAAEIAELMNCHEKTVQYRLKTARIKIKDAVERYEKENRDTLHAVVPFMLISQLFRAQAESVCVPSVSAVPTATSALSNANALDVPSDQAAAAVKTGGKTMLNTLKAKIIAGACAAAVVGGGVTAAVVVSGSSDQKPETSITSSPNVSGSSNSSKPQIDTSKPETSKPVSADKVVYPEFKGLKPYKFISRIKGVNQPDTVSGNIKEMRRGNGAFILLTNDNEVVVFRADAYEVKVSYGIDPNVTTLDNTYYDDHNGDGFLAVNGDYITYKAVGNDGEIRLSKEGAPRSFSGDMDFGDRITKVVMGDGWRFYALDAEGLSVKLTHRFWGHSESPIYRDCVSVMDGDYVYYSTGRDWGIEVGGVKVKEFAGDYCLTDEGRMFDHDDRKPLDFLSEYTFKDIFYDNYTNNGIISGLSEDDKLVVFDAANKKVKFRGELPDGALKDIWQDSDRVVVKTDKGIYAAEFESDTELKPDETLTATGEEVVSVCGRYVLLGNGYVYKVDN